MDGDFEGAYEDDQERWDYELSLREAAERDDEDAHREDRDAADADAELALYARFADARGF